MNPTSAYRRGDTTAAPRTVSTTVLREHCGAVFRAAGLAAETAELVADSLVDAEAGGVASHGVNRTRIYAERLRAGLIDAHARPRIVRERPGGMQIDAGNAIGHLGAQTAVDSGIRLAERSAVCVAGVGNSNHCGTLAYFTRQIAAAGLVGIAMSTAPPTMVYHGGRTRAVGTNPISIAVPRASGPAVTVDMATSATARGKIILANQAGGEIPDGWAVDRDGRPTTDPAEALLGSVLPFAGPKGSGLAMMVDLLAGGLMAGASGEQIGDMYEDWTREQRVGHLFVVIDPDGWIGRAAFAEHVEQFGQRVSALPPAEGFERVLLPGELEDNARAAAERDGLRLSGSVVADLDAIAAEFGLSRRLADTTPRSRP